MAEPLYVADRDKPYLQVKIPEGYQNYTGGVSSISIPIFRLNPETNTPADIRANEHAEAVSKIMAFGIPAASASSIVHAGIDTTNAGSQFGTVKAYEQVLVKPSTRLTPDTGFKFGGVQVVPSNVLEPGIPFGQVGDENAPLYRTADNLGRITEEPAVMGGLDQYIPIWGSSKTVSGDWKPWGAEHNKQYTDLSQGYAGLYGNLRAGHTGMEWEDRPSAYPGLAESVAAAEKAAGEEAEKRKAAGIIELAGTDLLGHAFATSLGLEQGQLDSVLNAQMPAALMTPDEMAAAHAKGELTAFDEVLNDWPKDERMIQPLDAAGNPMGEPFIDPVLALALTYATNQAGFVSDVQVATATAEGNLAIAKQQGINDQALAAAQNRSESFRTKLKTDTDITLAGLQAEVDQARFETEQNLEELRVNAQLAQGTEQHEQVMEQLGLNRAQLTEEYKVRSEQIAAEAAEGLRRYDLDEAESLRRYNLQLAIQAGQSEDAARNFAKEMEDRKIERDLRSEDIDRQIKRDEIMAQTDIDVAEIQRLMAGDTAGINQQIALREAERDEALAAIQQQTITTTGAQQLQATLAGTEADIQIATTQAQAQKEAQLAIQALQDSAAIDELTKAKEVAQLYATSEKEAQIAIQTLRETTILGDLEKAKAIATLQQAMQITAQTATAALQVNQGISDVEKAKAVATIQENTRASTDLAIAELQANTKITELEKTNILATMQAGATTQAATTQAGAVTGAAALQAEAASPFGYVGAGEDAADRAQRLTDAQTILGAEFNPYGLSNAQFTGMQDVAAQAGATPFGALATAPDARYQDILGVQQAQAAAGPFQAAQLGQGMGDISTILRGGNTPEQQLALAQAPGNPFGLTANEQMALQNSLARGGLTPTQRLAEVQAGAAPQNMANYLNFIGNPAAVGFAGQSGFLQNMADSPEGNLPASLFGLNVPQAAPTVPTNPTMADLTNLTDEQLGFYQGQQAAQNYQTPSQIFQQAQTVTPQGV